MSSLRICMYSFLVVVSTSHFWEYMSLSPSNETRRYGSCYSPSGIFPYEGLYLLSVGGELVIRRAEYCREKISTYLYCMKQILEASHIAEAAVVVVTVVVHITEKCAAQPAVRK